MLKKILFPFFSGIAAALGALIFQLAFSLFFPEKNFPAASAIHSLTPLLIIFAVSEEFFKFAVIWKISHGIERKKDILLAALLAGLGFSLTEISLVTLNESFAGSVLYQGLIGLSAVHLFTSLLFGLSAIQNGARKKLVVFSFFLVAVIFHLAYNFLIISAAPAFMIYAFLSLLLAILFFLIFRAGQKYF